MEKIIELAKQAALNSHCNGQRVGAVIFIGGSPLATGWNQTTHDCLSRGFCYEGVTSCLESDRPSRAIHAEIVAIANCSKKSLSPEGTSIYVTHAPCINCVKAIAAAGIKEILIDRKQENSKMWWRNYDFIEENLLIPYQIHLKIV